MLAKNEVCCARTVNISGEPIIEKCILAAIQLLVAIQLLTNCVQGSPTSDSNVGAKLKNIVLRGGWRNKNTVYFLMIMW